MCLVLRVILLLSLNWWGIGVSAQEKQETPVSGAVPVAQPSSVPQAQQPPQQESKKSEQDIKKIEDVKKLEADVKQLQQDVQKVGASAQQVAQEAKDVAAQKAVQTATVEEQKKQDQEVKPEEKKVEAKQPDEAPKVEPAVTKATQELVDTKKIEEEAKKAEDAKKLEADAKKIGADAKKLESDAQKLEEARKVEEAARAQELKTQEAKQAEQARQAESKTAQVPSKTLEQEDADIKGIDTVDLAEPRGNWLFKRIWWNRAENKYEKIRSVFGNILESRIAFFTKRSAADTDLFSPFYFEIGMNNGELQQLVSQLIGYIETQRKKEGLQASEQEVLQLLLAEKKSLESINADVLAVNKLDKDIDETVKRLMDQIERARKYEREAWNNFKEIARVLSDTKARELFYQMDTAHSNLKDIQEYISQALIVHLDRVVTKAKNQIDRIKTTIETLRKKGHDLQDLADTISGKKAPATARTEETEEVEEEPEEQAGFFANIISSITSAVGAVWDTIKYVVTLPFSWFTSTESEEIEQEEVINEDVVSESEE